VNFSAVADTQRLAASGSARYYRQILHKKDDYPNNASWERIDAVARANYAQLGCRVYVYRLPIIKAAMEKRPHLVEVVLARRRACKNFFYHDVWNTVPQGRPRRYVKSQLNKFVVGTRRRLASLIIRRRRCVTGLPSFGLRSYAARPAMGREYRKGRSVRK
jgi:hypothetical protein